MNLILLTLFGLAILGVAGRRLLQLRASREEVFYTMRCAACSQKVRYSARKAGSEGMCPRCKGRFLLPATPESLSKSGPAERVGQRILVRAKAV